MRSFFEFLEFLRHCATFYSFLLTLELDIELEFDGLLCIVTRAIVYPKKLTIPLF